MSNPSKMLTLDDLKYFLTTYRSLQFHIQNFHVPNVDPASHPLQLPRARVVICGDVSSGKSTFINALLGKDILPCGEAKCTSRITIITKSRDNIPRLVLLNPDGETVAQEHVLTEDPDRTRELLNALAAAKDAEARATHLETTQIVRWEFVGNALLDAGLELVDTPGMNESRQVLEKVTELLQESVLVFYLLPITAGCVTTEHTAALQRLKESSRHNVTPMVVITKVDDAPSKRCKTVAARQNFASQRKRQLTDMYREVQTIFPDLRRVADYLKSDYFHGVSAEDALSALEEGREYPRMEKLINSVVPVVSSQLRVAARACLQHRIDSVVSTLEVQRTSVRNATLAAGILTGIQQQIRILCPLDTLKGDLVKTYDQSMQRLNTMVEALVTCTIPAFDPNHPKGLTMQQQAVQYIASLIERELAVSMNDVLYEGQRVWGDTLFRSLEGPLKSLGMPCWVAGRKNRSLDSTMSQTMSKLQFWHKIMTWMGLSTELTHVQANEDMTRDGRIRIVQAILSHYNDNKTKENILKECVAVGEQTLHELETTVNELITKVDRRVQGLDTASLPASVVDVASKVVPLYQSVQMFPHEPVVDEDHEIVSWNHWGNVHKIRWEDKDCYVQLIHANLRPPVLRYLVQLEHYESAVVLKNQPDVVAVLMREPPTTCDAVFDSLMAAPLIDRNMIGILKGVPLATTRDELRTAVRSILEDDTLADQHMGDIEAYYYLYGDFIRSKVQTNVRDDDASVMFGLKVLGLYTLENPKGSLYGALNTCLRGENRKTEIVKGRCGVYLATALNSLRKYCRKTTSKTLYRGLNCVPDMLETKFSTNRPGGLYWYTFTSTSTSLDEAKNIARRGAVKGRKMTIFHIEAIEAYDIGFLSVFPKEEEWIMVPGVHFECTRDPDTTSDPEFVHVYLRQVMSDAYLLP